MVGDADDLKDIAPGRLAIYIRRCGNRVKEYDAHVEKFDRAGGTVRITFTDAEGRVRVRSVRPTSLRIVGDRV